MMRIFVLSIMAASLQLFQGCSDADSQHESTTFTLPSDVTEIYKRSDVPFPEGEPKTIDEMKDDDVIVAVNGFPLTKKDFDKWIELKAKYLQRDKGSRGSVLGMQIKEYRKMFVDEFVTLRVLIDKAHDLEVTTSEAVNQFITRIVENSAKRKGKSVEQFLKPMEDDLDLYFYQMGRRHWITALVQKDIPPLVDVTPDFVSNVQHQVTIDNQIAAASNKVIYAKMDEWRKDIIEGRKTFEDVVKEHSQDYDETNPVVGFWDNFELGEFDDKRVENALFSLEAGGVSEVFSDDNGYHFVKIVHIDPPVYNDKNEMVQNEVRVMAHVYMDKEPPIMRLSDEDLELDLKNQMQLRAIQEYADNLKTNGEYRIEFPHGKKFFK